MMTLSGWQRICAWSGLVAGVLWATKFLLLLVRTGEPLAPLTGFVMPTLGSILGAVAAFGVAVPFLRQQPARIAAPVLVVVGLITIVVVSAVSNAAQHAVSETRNEVVRTEMSALVAGVMWLAAAAWMFIAGSGKGPSTPEPGDA